MSSLPGIRLQKYLADRGVASRRHCELLMTSGRVAVNGRLVTELGSRLIPGVDVVAVDGVPLPALEEKHRTLMLFKPRGYECSTVPSSPGHRTVYTLLNGIRERIVPVGRLDTDSEGMLLMSNDGALIQRVTHPRHGHAKTYEVTVRGVVGSGILARLNGAMVIDGYTLEPVAVTSHGPDTSGRGHCLRFVLREGRNRQIRKMCASVGLRVLHLRRTAIQGLTLSGLAPGQWRDLTLAEVEQLSRPVTATPKSQPLREPSRARPDRPAPRSRATRGWSHRGPAGA